MMGQGGMSGMMGGMAGQGMPRTGWGQGMPKVRCPWQAHDVPDDADDDGWPGRNGHAGMMGRSGDALRECPRHTGGDDAGTCPHLLEAAPDQAGQPAPEARRDRHGRDGSITAEIVTVDGSLVQKLAFNRYPGLVRQVD
jgi:hypothetical protein